MVKRVVDRAIIFLSRGYEDEEDCKKYLYPLEKQIINKFTNIPCYRAYYDDSVRRKIYEKNGVFIDDLRSSIELAKSKGAKRLWVIVFTPVITDDYINQEKIAYEYREDFKNIVVSGPISDINILEDSIKLVEKALVLDRGLNAKFINNLEKAFIK